MQDYIYSAMAGVALVIHLVINFEQLFGRPEAGASKGQRECRGFLFSLLAYYVVDALWGVFAGLGSTTLLYVDTLLCYFAMALAVMMWCRYVVAYLDIEKVPGRFLSGFGRLLVGVYTVLLAANFSTGYFFTFDAQGAYTPGPLRNIAFDLLIAFNAAGAVASLIKARHETGSLRRRYMTIFLFGLTMTLATILQVVYPLLPLYALGYLVGCCFLHAFVIEDEKDDLRRTVLAHELECERAQEAERAKSLFFSSVSHDLRTPLNAIVGFSELLEQGVDDPAERARYVSTIRASGQVLVRLINDILDLSKLESGNVEIIPEPTDVPAVVREVVEAFGVARSKKSVMFDVETAEMPLVNVDSQRIRQFLYNLMSNAFKYTDRGWVHLRTAWRDGTLALSVEDTGRGISQPDIDRILQPFVQIQDRNHRDGTGLGLPICRKLAELMGGELSVKSTVGQGSTFTITLHGVPVAQKETGSSVPLPKLSRPEIRDAQAVRVLAVDDAVVNLHVLKALLVRCGVKEVVMAENGRKALEILKTDRAFDFILTDLWMPELDGEGLMRAIRADADLAKLPVYLVTADVESVHEDLAEGFTGILLKPITFATINTLLGPEAKKA